LKLAGWNAWENSSPPIKIYQLIQLIIAIIGGSVVRRAAVARCRKLPKRSFNPISGGWLMLRWPLIFKPQGTRHIEAQ